jgi:hypothetical protein
MRVAWALVNSGDTVSTAFGLGNADRVAIWCPVVTACGIRLLGSFNQTSANFVPVAYDTTSAGARLSIDLGTGSKMVIVGNVGTAFAKLDLTAAQTAPRSFAVMSIL